VPVGAEWGRRIRRGAAGVCLALLLGLLPSPSAGEAEPPEGPSPPLNLWPVYDQRVDPVDEAAAQSSLGPLFFSTRATRAGWREGGFRPFFTWREEPERQKREWQFLYPLAQYTENEGDWEFQFLYLLNLRGEGSVAAEREERADFFPFYLSGRREDGQTYRWIFPFGGTVYDRLGRDEIEIRLFPFYLRSVRLGAERSWFPWPFLSRLRGEERSGFAVWPFYGQEEWRGHYQRRYALWPLLLHQRTGLEGDNPEESLAVLPFYFSQRSPERDLTVVLWPFFSHLEDRKRGYEQWEFPWPLFAIARGEERQITRFLPFFAMERRVLRNEFLLRELVSETTAILFPLYSRTVDATANSRAERERILWWLYSDLRETGSDGDTRRIDGWPLFRYVRDREGAQVFQTLALLEAFLPGNELVERNYSPLWALYTYRRSPSGNAVHSLLWNLVRHERRPEGYRLEVLGPLLSFEERDGASRFSFLGGLFACGRDGESRSVELLGMTARWMDPPPVRVAATLGGDR